MLIVNFNTLSVVGNLEWSMENRRNRAFVGRRHIAIQMTGIVVVDTMFFIIHMIYDGSL